MVVSELVQAYLDRFNEARLYCDQGLRDIAVELFEKILRDIDEDEALESESENLRSWIQSELDKLKGQQCTPPEAPPEVEGRVQSEEVISPAQAFQYGKALMDGQFWEEAIQSFKQAAAIGFRIMDCWELCGDCCARMERWDEAIRYYEIIYTDPNTPADRKQQFLHKISKCSQTQKEIEVKSFLNTRSVAPKAKETTPQTQRTEDRRSEYLNSSIVSLGQSSIIQMLGQSLTSWRNQNGQYLAHKERCYLVLNLLHIGTTSVIVELQEETTGKRFAGQCLNAPFNNSLSPSVLAKWVHAHLMLDSQCLVKVHDLAHNGDFFFIVREHLPLSLVDILSGKEVLPIPLAILFAYRMLEGLGDLHLRRGLDGQIRKMYHLDLRPSRVLLHDEKPTIKIYNGGLWTELEQCNPNGTSMQRLPLPFLAYRAPEQFRPYLARRKPPVFTDIYLFGTLFYEMLTGYPLFRAASFEESEIQHCDQYPTSPKVWRPEIPEELSEMVMKCLDCDPTKRWRSATQLSLSIEKTFNQCLKSTVKDGSYREFLGRLKAA